VEKKQAALKLLELVSSQISSNYKDKLSKKTKDIIGLNFDELADDVTLLSIPSEYMLGTTAGMTKFLVDFYVGTVESISSQIELVKEMIIKQEKGEIRGIKEAIQRAYDNPKNKRREYENIQVKLDSVSGKLKEYILSLISEIRSIDKQKPAEFFIKSLWNRGKINSSIKLIKLCIDALESVVDIQMIVGIELKDNTDSVIYNYKDFYKNELMRDDNCRLLQEYEFDKLQNQGYFLKLPDRVRKVEMLRLTYNNFVDEYTSNNVGEYVDSIEGYDKVIL
jgi:hypothetical protein